LYKVQSYDTYISRCISGSSQVTYQFNGCVLGSGRVTFSSYKSYVKAVSAAFVEIKTAKFTKKVRMCCTRICLTAFQPKTLVHLMFI